MKINYIIISLSLLIFNLGNSQVKELNGEIIANEDLEGVHVLNTTSKTHSTTNQFGAFTILAKAQDTILFSSVQYKRKIVVVTNLDFEKELFTVSLEDRVNELDEVIVGKLLTGNLGADIANSDVKRSINFYDLGIPGYTGPRKTYSERLFHDVTSTKGGSVEAILNIISGRKKKLELKLLNERIFALRDKLEEEYKIIFFETFTLDEKFHEDFFYFCAEHDDFLKRCERNTGLNVITFLEEQLIAYKKIMTINED